MPSSTESSHVNNVENFGLLIDRVKGLGDAYVPTADELKVASLEALYSASQPHFDAVNKALADFDTVRNLRRQAFAPLPALSTRIMHAASALGISPETQADFQRVNRKIQGGRKTPAAAPGTSPTSDGDTLTRRSVSQRGFDNMVAHLNELVVLCESEVKYKPQEEDLKAIALRALYNRLTKINRGIGAFEDAYSRSLTARNRHLYTDTTGLVATAGNVKRYVSSVFGTQSDERKRLSELKFRSAKGN
jgi:hypothetical protein